MTAPTSPAQPTEYRLTLTLSPEQYQALQVLRHRAHLTNIGLVRKLIEAAYRMAIGGQAFCADGQGCKCPMLHVAPTPPAHLQIPASHSHGGGNQGAPGLTPPGAPNGGIL